MERRRTCSGEQEKIFCKGSDIFSIWRGLIFWQLSGFVAWADFFHFVSTAPFGSAGNGDQPSYVWTIYVWTRLIFVVFLQLLDQPSLLKDKLKPLLKKNGSLTCTKCKQKFMKILPFVSHTEECIGIVVNGNVTCSSCNKSMPKKDWSHHKIRHNNMTWRVGEHPLVSGNIYYQFFGVLNFESVIL